MEKTNTCCNSASNVTNLNLQTKSCSKLLTKVLRKTMKLVKSSN